MSNGYTKAYRKQRNLHKKLIEKDNELDKATKERKEIYSKYVIAYNEWKNIKNST